MMKNKEKLVRDLVNTFNDRDELHKAYKEKIKNTLCIFVGELSIYLENEQDANIDTFIESFIEERFRPKD